jgi:hypothetical protein
MKDIYRKVIFLLLYLGASLSTLYLISLDILKSNLLIGFTIYLVIFLSYSFLVNLIGLLYRFTYKIGKPLPGIFSSLQGHLTQEQMNNLSADNNGKVEALIYEYLIMRMDILLPAAIVFGAIIFITLPSIANTSLNELVLSEIAGLFALSYLFYTGLQAYMFAVKTKSSMGKGEVDMSLVIASTLEGAT